MKKILSLFGLVLALWFSPAHAQVLSNPTSNPTGANIGWTRAHWVRSVNKILFAYGYGSNFAGNNSVQLYDPTANTWSTLFANNNGTSGPNNRDNHISFYNSNLDQFWVYGGTFIAGTYVRSGRFGPIASSPTWIATGTTDAGAFAGVIKNFGGGGSDSGVAWDHSCNCGVIFSGNDSALRRMWIIEPNVGGGKCVTSDGVGSEPYNMCEILESGVWPDGLRSQCEGCLTNDGNGTFYLVGGSLDISNHYDTVYKWNYTTGVWTQLPDVPVVGYTSVATYDTDLGLVLSRGDSFLAAYDVATDVWMEINSLATDACVWSPAGIYAPTVKKHFYQYGQICHTGGAQPPAIAAVSISGFNANGKLYLAPGLWVTKPFPLSRTDAQNQTIGELTYGPGFAASGAKHQTIKFGGGRLYFIGGDFFNAPFGGAYRTDIFSYDILAPYTVSEPNRWRTEWPYCGLSGEIGPGFIDEAPVAIDTLRDKIMYAGGFQGDTGTPLAGVCSPYGITGTYYSQGGAPDNPPAYLEFDLATNRYSTRSGFTLHPYGQSKTAVFNPTTNEMILVRDVGFSHMKVDTGVWRQVETVCATPGPGVLPDSTGGCAASGTNYINDIQIFHEQMALDIENQVLYVIDVSRNSESNPINQRFRLLKYNVATGGVTNYGFITMPVGSIGTLVTDPPQVPGVTQPHFCNYNATHDRTCLSFPFYGAPQDSTMLVYDSVNNKVLWPASNNAGRPILMVFDPVTATWTVDPMIRDRPEVILHGSVGTYIPEINAMVMFGGMGWVPGGGYGGGTGAGFIGTTCPNCNIPITHWSMYRFGGTAPLLPVATLATLTVGSMNPSSGAVITVSPVDNNGAGDGTTPFSRVFTISDNKTVTLVAAATAGGNPFADWAGCDSVGGTGNRTCTVLATSNKTLTPVYQSSPPVNRNLTINSTPAGIPMTLSSGTCPATPCVVAYTEGTTVTVTAPLTHGAASYTIWGGNVSSLAGRVATVVMSANKTVSAPYVSGSTYRNSVDFSNVQGQRGWSYLNSLGTLFSYANGRWEGPEASEVILPGGLVHPGTTHVSMLRYTAQATGPIRITGVAWDADSGGGDGVDVSVIKNGATTLLAATTIENGDTVGISLNISDATATVGDTYDFRVAPRAGGNNNDATVFDAIIAPETSGPATAKFVVGGDAKFGVGVTFGK